MSQTVLVIGGTGAQGGTVVRTLAGEGSYKVKVLTRDASSFHAKEIASIPNVSTVEGDPHNEPDLAAALEGIDAVFVNHNGFAIGPMREMYWGIRTFELARRAGVKHFVYGGLEYLGDITNYQDKYRVGHYYGKGIVGEFMKSQPTTPMAWTNVCSGPYMEMLSGTLRPRPTEDGTMNFYLPLQDGAMPFIHLDDLGRYVLWALKTPAESSGLTLGIATQHVSGQMLADAFTAVSGKPARYVDIPLATWLASGFGHLLQGVKTKVGVREGKEDESLLSYEDNFGAWFEVYRASGSNTGILKKDYALLDKILPGRIKSVEEWMRLVKFDGTPKDVLKDNTNKNV